MIKRLLSLLLAVVIVFGAMPVVAFAEETADSVPVTITVDNELRNVNSTGNITYTGLFGTEYTLPFYVSSVPQNTDFVIGISASGDGKAGRSRKFNSFRTADGTILSGDYPYTFKTDYISYFALSGDEVVEKFGNVAGVNLNNTIVCIEVRYGDEGPIYGLLVELLPPETPTYTVTLPAQTAGYTVSTAAGSSTTVEEGGSYSFTVSINESYEKSDGFAVKANGISLTENDGVYTVHNITADQSITVEGVMAKPTADTLTVTAEGENCPVTSTGLTSYRQLNFGTVSNVPVYKVSVPENTDFVVNWNFAADGGDSVCRYVFALDAGGDMGSKYYPFTMHTASSGNYILDAQTVTECFGTDIGLDLNNRIAFLEVYNSEMIEGDGNPLYGLLVELVPQSITVNFTLLGDHKHTDDETAVHTLIDGNLETWVAAQNYEVAPGTTVNELLEMVLSDNGMVSRNPSGNYVEAITKDGVRIGQFTNGSLSGWMYTLNGVHPGLGVAEQTLKDGDVVIFHYTDDYTREDNDPAVLAVEALINRIGTVTLDSEGAIAAARQAYDALTDAQKQQVTNYGTLTDAEAELTEMKKAAEDEAAANAVETLIAAIGAVDLSREEAVKAARSAYNALTDGQKALVENYEILTAAEKALAELKKTEEDEAAAVEVESLIDAIGTVTEDSTDTIRAARAAYDKLTDTQKALVDNYSTLEAAEAALEKLKQEAIDEAAANAAEQMIDGIGIVTLESEGTIAAAREAYDALTEEQKQMVENYEILTAAEEKLIELKLPEIEKIYNTTGSYLHAQGTPGVGSIGGEWRIIGLARSDYAVAEDYYANVAAYVQETIDENQRLDEYMATENARVILALTAIGKDVTNVDGHNLLAGLTDMDYVTYQGLNGVIWTLIAFDSHGYEIPEGDVTREKLVNGILGAQLSDGGWALSGSASDPDMTGMALQALAPYCEADPNVKAVVEKAVSWLSAVQQEDGTFAGTDGASSESLAQVITALTALGIDPEKDERFIKNGISAVDALAAFYVADGGFRHVMSGEVNPMATEQGYYALTAYFRFLNGKTSLYNMTDVQITTAAENEAAANAVEEMIGAIGTVTAESGEAIEAARAAYDTLTDGQKELVGNYKNLTDAEAAYAELVKTEADEAAVSEVEKLIDAIGTVTLSSGDAIEKALGAYGKLTAVQKALVSNYGDLEAAEKALAKLKADDAAANAVETLIAAIGTVTEESDSPIRQARRAYDALTEDQKQLVGNYKTLTDAEAKLESMKQTITVSFTLLGDSAHGDTDMPHTLSGGGLTTWIARRTFTVKAPVTVLDILELALAGKYSFTNNGGNYISSINGLGEFANGANSGWMYTLNGSHSSLGVAEQYLKDGDVIIFHYTDNYTIESGSQGYGGADAAAAEKAAELIDGIGTVTLDKVGEIEAARKAYDALTMAQKQMVDNYSKLTAAETKLAQLKKNADEEAAEKVEDLIDKIRAASATYEDDVKAAQRAYSALAADQKKLVDNYDKLINALKELADEDDKEAAEAVEKRIQELGAITLDSEEDIQAAREAYDKLTDEQKALVGNLADLEAAEEKLEQLKADAVTEDIYKSTGDCIEDLGTPVPGSIGGEWMVIGLTRSGREVPGVEDYYESVVKYVQENIDENQRLHSTKSSDNSRIILALTALGKDVTDVGGHDLLAGLNDMAFVQKQGINGPIWALIAFDSGNYPTPDGDVTREALLRVILDAQLADGGWALSGETSDADMTGMALQALAPYYESSGEVKAAVDTALITLSEMQASDGSYGSIDGPSSESIAQVIAALAALGIDADTDPRFIKNGVSAVDALCAFYVEGGGFRHTLTGELDGMATEQGYYALTAYFRFLNGKTSLYNMIDVIDMGGDAAPEAESAETLPTGSEPVDADGDKGSFPWWVIIMILMAGVVIVIAVPVIKKKHMK